MKSIFKHIFIGFTLNTILAGCSSLSTNDEPNPPVTESILLPRLYETTNSIDKAQVLKMSNDYFVQYVTMCGIPDKPEDHKTFWSSELWGSYTGNHLYGILWIRKKDGEVFMQPSPKTGKYPNRTLWILGGRKIGKANNRAIE